MLASSLLLLALLVPQTGPRDAVAWGDVELPVGFHLDLETGWVSNRAPEEADLGVSWDGETLMGPALLTLIPGASERAQVERGEGSAPQAGASALVGSEYVYELGERGWGYLRVLATDPGRVTIERTHSRPDEVELTREPAGISWNAKEEGIELSWAKSTLEGARWLVERRTLLAAGESVWEPVGSALSPWWTDTEAAPDVVLEYRVIRDGGAMGARVRSVAGGLSDGPIEVTQGTGINALTGAVGGPRTDLRLEFINPKGVQIGPGDGVIMRTLVPSGREAWELPHQNSQGFGAQRYFLSEGRDLALYLPEGLYARLSLVGVGDGKVSMRVSAALDGGRVLLPAPKALEARGLSDGGAEVSVEVPSGHAGLGLGEPILILEREHGFETEEWVFVTEEVTGGRGRLIDPLPGVTGPCRYRSRVRLGPFGPSAPSAPISVLLGDDGGEQADEWIREAVEELGLPGYEQRQRARELLAIVGERARPHLLAVVSSENPEQAAAARELLSGMGREEKSAQAVEALVPDILLQRASELGLLEEALPGFLSADPMRRAHAALKSIDADSVRGHLELLAESDPELFVRDAASMALTLPPRAPATSLRAPLEALELAEIVEDLEFLEAPDPAQLADDLAGAVREADTWTALVALQVSEDLLASIGDLVEEEAATSRARLALALLRDRAGGRDSPESFLAAALDVVDDPLVRLSAVRRLVEQFFETPSHAEEALQIEAGDFDDLASVLDECRRSGDGEFIVVPEGVYEVSGNGPPSLSAGGEGVHLVGEGEVIIRASFFIHEGASITLENVRIEPSSGVGITITDGELLLKDCYISTQSMGIQATDSVVALSNSVITEPPRAGAGRGGKLSVRLVGLSALFARASRIVSSSTCVQGARLVYLDTCSFSSRVRCAVEAQGRMEIFAERSVLSGTYAALSGGGMGVLDGVVLESDGHAALRVGERLHICREHTSGGDEEGELFSKGIACDCTLEHR